MLVFATIGLKFELCVSLERFLRRVPAGMEPKIDALPYKWPSDGILDPKTTALVVIDMQMDCTGFTFFQLYFLLFCALCLFLLYTPLLLCLFRVMSKILIRKNYYLG